MLTSSNIDNNYKNKLHILKLVLPYLIHNYSIIMSQIKFVLSCIFNLFLNGLLVYLPVKQKFK